ncbi:coiled-coil domain-containing protein 170 [Suncus etruscus]|uniref:coiled-coil domain-containing protein 170 n=1 Tax=Suncus etruscus TaxID=109475 RepID=UPI00210F4B4D|nr:coiled-coil domain-containing protein 170 [Suncus etruscus]
MGPRWPESGFAVTGHLGKAHCASGADVKAALERLIIHAVFSVLSLGEHWQDPHDCLPEVAVTREQFHHYRNVAENAQSELAATLVKFECAQSELRELRSKMLSKEASCQELKAEMESYKENNARKTSLLASLKDRVQELEEELVVLSNSKTRMEITAHRTVKENQELKNKVIGLQEKLQKCLTENEETKNQISNCCRRHQEFLVQLRNSLDPSENSEASEEELILKLRALLREDATLRAQVVALEEASAAQEGAAEASRATLSRLAAEAERGQRQAAAGAQERDRLSQDLLHAIEAKESLEREAKVLQERLFAGQRLWGASKQELSLLKESFCELEKNLKASVDTAAVFQSKYSSFREKIAALLQGSLDRVGTTEGAILEKIQEMHLQDESRRRMVSQLEAQISELVEQLGNESGFHQKALERAQKAENKLEMLQGQLIHLEGELVSRDILRDNLHFEKQKYLKFLDQLSEKMKLDQMAADLGFDMRLDVVLARTEQLVRLESNAVIENKTIAHNLQRKLKTQKERLESRELHMKLLRQKIIQLEEEKQVRTSLAVERDEAQLTIRKLQKKTERLQKELSDCQEFNTELKAKLMDTSELKIKTLEQIKTIEDLNKCKDKLEKMKEKAEKKLLTLKSELDSTEHEAKEDKERSRKMIQGITSEMKTLKKSLEEAEKREKQLVDFKEVVSQMLGLNVSRLALPDYEIIKCLERLIHSYQHHFVTCACLQNVTSGGEKQLKDL